MRLLFIVSLQLTCTLKVQLPVIEKVQCVNTNIEDFQEKPEKEVKTRVEKDTRSFTYSDAR